jgi:hypothetical protein
MAYLAIGLFEYLVVDVGRNKVLAVEDGVFGVAYEILLGREACYDFVVVEKMRRNVDRLFRARDMVTVRAYGIAVRG